jgi:hypothetical protein
MNIGDSSSQYDPDVGCADPNRMRDKRILELKAKHNYYVMPTFNSNNLRMNTKKYKHEFDNDTLTIYSGGGYIAKSRLGSSYSKRRRTAFGSSKRSTNNRPKRDNKRFNEQLDVASQKSVNSRRALSRGMAATRSVYVPTQANRPMTGKAEHLDQESIKNQILDQIEKMSKDEVDKMSKQIDQITHDGDHESDHIGDTRADMKFDRDNYNTLEGHKEHEGSPDRHNDPENQDTVQDLPQNNVHDYYDQPSHKKPRSKYSRSSKRSSKSYIHKLKEDLDKEKEERVKLESEIEELKKISSEISSRLGINNA